MDKNYEDIRHTAILAYSKIFKDSLAFDIAEATKEQRVKLVEDPVYISSTKKLKAELYAKQLQILQQVIDGQHSDPDKGNASEMLKAIEMRNKLLFNDLNIEADDSNMLNVCFLELKREDLEGMETVEILLPQSNAGRSLVDEIEPIVPKKNSKKGNESGQ
jgi:hypothetical protein